MLGVRQDRYRKKKRKNWKKKHKKRKKEARISSGKEQFSNSTLEIFIIPLFNMYVYMYIIRSGKLASSCPFSVKSLKLYSV